MGWKLCESWDTNFNVPRVRKHCSHSIEAPLNRLFQVCIPVSARVWIHFCLLFSLIDSIAAAQLCRKRTCALLSMNIKYIVSLLFTVLRPWELKTLIFYNPPPHLTVPGKPAHMRAHTHTHIYSQSPQGNNRMLETLHLQPEQTQFTPTGFSPNPSIEFLPPTRGRCCSLSSPISESKR